jgi:hypothetical protein
MSLENSDTKDDDKISKSPDRHTFQKEGAIRRAEEKGEPLNEDYLNMFEKILEDHKHKFDDPARRVNNMEYDLLTTDWILDKVRASESYAQNLYAAMCNMRFVRKEMFPYLRQDPDRDLWSASWRGAGGIVADMRQQGDYIDWYCSGMGGLNGSYDPEGGESFEEWQARTAYVPESQITEEIEQDLLKLGWIPVPWDDNDLI